MLPVGARAIILLLNGVQVLLPGPAFVHGGRAWVPARAVLERCGHEVRWDAGRAALAVGSPAAQHSFPVIDGLPSAPPSRDRPFSAARLRGVVYLPLAALGSLGLGFRYDPATRTATVTGDQGRPPAVSVAAILTDPPGWLGRPVRLTGEYLGWSPYPFCWATAEAGTTTVAGTATVGDFVLRGDGGAIYCHPAALFSAAPSGGSLKPEGLPLTPYQTLGRRLTVTGHVSLARDGRPRLDYHLLAPVPGLPGVTCLLRLDRDQYAPGETVCGVLTVTNPHREPLGLPADGRGPDLTVAAPDGKLTVTKLSLADLIMGREGSILPAAAECEMPVAWELPVGAPSGVYHAVAHLTEGLETLPAAFRVAAPADTLVSTEAAGP